MWRSLCSQTQRRLRKLYRTKCSALRRYLTGDYVDLECVHGEITLNGTKACLDQTIVQIYWGPADGHTYWYWVAAEPDSGYVFHNWSVPAGVCLPPPGSCHGTSTVDPVNLSSSCPNGQHCGSGTVVVTFVTIPTPKTQYNWAGYLIGSTGSFIQVSGSWIQPSVSCNATNADASTWAGIDGYVTSGTGPIPEQGGTTAWCISGAASYVGWYEDPLTSGFVNITGSGYTVKAGDRITANVTYSPSTGYFVITVMDKIRAGATRPRLSLIRERWRIRRSVSPSGFCYQGDHTTTAIWLTWAQRNSAFITQAHLDAVRTGPPRGDLSAASELLPKLKW